MMGLGTGAFQFFVPGSATGHPVMWITWLNVMLVLVATFFSVYYAIWGRKTQQWLMLFNFALCTMVLVLYVIFFLDIYWKDFLSKTDVSLWIIKPLYTVVLTGWITNIITSARK